MKKKYTDMTLPERQAAYAALQVEYESAKALHLTLNMARGKPGQEQLDLVTPIFGLLTKPEQFVSDGVETRNYGEVAGIPRKPAPDMLYKAMADIGVEKCIYIGDSEVDVTTAHGAGLPCLSVTWGFRDEDQIRAAGGTHFCHETKELAPMLRQMLEQL